MEEHIKKQQSAKTNAERWKKEKNNNRKLESMVEHQRLRCAKVVFQPLTGGFLPAIRVFARRHGGTSRSAGETQVFCVLFFFLLEDDILCLRSADREAPGEGVKIPALSKTNPLSHAMTFTAAPERGSVRGGCPASVSLVTVCRTRFPPFAQEKSSIDGREPPAEGQEEGRKRNRPAFFPFHGRVFASGPKCMTLSFTLNSCIWGMGGCFR